MPTRSRWPRAIRGSPRRRSTCSPAPPIAEFEQRARPGAGLGAADPGPRPARRRGADPRLRSRSRLSVQRHPRGGIGRAAGRCAPPIISTGSRRGSPPRSAFRPRPGRSTTSTRGCARPGTDGMLAVSPRKLRALSERAGLDLGAYGADPGAAGLRLGRGARGAAGGDRRDTLRQPRDPAKLVADAVRDAGRDGVATSRRAGRSTSSSAPAGWSISNSPSTRFSCGTGSASIPHLEDALAALVEAGPGRRTGSIRRFAC